MVAWKRPMLLCSGVHALLTMLILLTALDVAAGAATRKVVFIVEEPYGDAGAPPSGEQVLRGLDVRERLSERIRPLHLESVALSDGRPAIDPPVASLFESADLVLQIKIIESSLGFRVDGQIFDKQQQKWIEVMRQSFQDEPAATLEVAIAKAILPPLFVRVLELTQPADRPVIFADCLISGVNEFPGRLFSSRYAKALQDSDYFKKKFAVVPFVTSVLPKDYKWWCLDLDVPRSGMARVDTATLYGAIDSQGSPDKPQLFLSLELQRLDSSHISKGLINVDLDQLPKVLQEIERVAEDLANEQ